MRNRNGLLPQTNNSKLLVRPRLNALLSRAIEKRLVIVCGGMGYGKTRAIDDFIKESKLAATWMQLSEHDNIPSRFWGTFINAVSKLTGGSADDEFAALGFPNTEDKLNRCVEIFKRCTANLPYQKYIRVLDDFHIIKNPEVLTFIERFLLNAPLNRCTILISRENPQISIAGMQSKDDVFIINEDDLNFTEIELSTYLSSQNLSVEPQVLREIYQDINGWAFSVNLVANSLKNSHGYFGFARNVMKKNIFSTMEAEVWNAISEELKHFLARLSLIEHLSEDIIEILAGGDQSLLDEFEHQSAYIRYDDYLGAYRIHQLFLDFLREQQNILSEDEIRNTYKSIAHWCELHNYFVDALGYYEKTNDYESIVSILFGFSFFLPYDMALHMLEIFERIPKETFLIEDYLAVMHLRIILSLGRKQEFNDLAEYYEQKFLKLPDDYALRNHTLGLIYYFKGLMRYFMSTVDGRYDFVPYFSKMAEYLENTPIHMGKWLANNLGPWANGFGGNDKESAAQYVEAVTAMGTYVNKYLNGIMIGLDGLALGEMNFYHGDIPPVGPLLISAIKSAKEVRQFDTIQRALFYTMRVALSQGKRIQADQALNDMKALLDEKEYAQRFITYDIALGWYYYALRQPDMVPNWLRGDFSPYGHAFYPENFGNQMKARYHYMTKNFPPLLTYIEEMKRRESILYGRIEMLALEACARYQMKDRQGAVKVFNEAYEAILPNGIIMPFIELGKDMRALVTFAINDPDCNIPHEWLESINKRASLYARYQATMISQYEKEIGISSWVALSTRETAILHDLFAGLSRTKIATRQKLSLSTVNMNIQSIYSKLHAHNVADVIRIAVERKLV